ncbi:glycerophosphodiester phosphodiesterase [Paenibacillus luteus]|uniref:glycerophosphodiester phosphodiesterase n=1 Tax=Paenibacillus luteus TaxID=2545753 RepID=UPI0013757A5F|nr:glycerophosphodiester phosphodiesterase family protein [Paenibacillus luteus]
MTAIKNIATMGFSTSYPENTMLAVVQALKAGADTLEVDVQLTKDGVVVLSHDHQIDRMTDGVGAISDYTYEQLSRFNAASRFMGGNEFQSIGYRSKGFEHLSFTPTVDAKMLTTITFQPIPRLVDVLALLQTEKASLIIEVKSHEGANAGIGEHICDLIKQHGLEKRCFISSFNHAYIHELSVKEPSISYSIMFVGQLFEAGKYAKELGASALQNCFISAEDTVVTAKSCRANGIELFVWSMGRTDTRAYNEQLLDYGVQGIITHNPELLSTVLMNQAHN